MGLPLRITYKDKDYLYQIVNSSSINNLTREVEILLNGEKVELVKDAREIWTQKNGDTALDPEFAQALGRSVALRFRM
ncbi:hypothetical protein [Rubrolithibacter danxiaensis]|uniref:hypothetical protein n=1 Tax=Rubrolithibacter danxiaensis TaxID=3390805 RepID=UPI003BF8F242